MQSRINLGETMSSDLQRRFKRPSSAVVGGTASALLAAIFLVAVGWLPLLNATLLLLFVLGLYGLTAIPNSRRVLLATVLVPTFLVGFLIAIYRPSGFDYPLVWSPGPLYEGGTPYSLYANLSKAIGGCLVIIWLWFGMRPAEQNLSSVRPQWEQWALVVAGACSIVFIAYAFFGVGLEPKWPDGILYFVGVNLLVTVLSEEAFFRLLLQRQIERFFSSRTIGISIAVAVSSVLFALAHSGATGAVFFLFLFAGFVYAAVYARTRSLTASIATHFGVNFVHIMLLEYPL